MSSLLGSCNVLNIDISAEIIEKKTAFYVKYDFSFWFWTYLCI